MASLKEIQKVIPGADTVAGRVIAFHQGKHYDLGQYVGDGAVVLSPEGEQLMAPPEDTPVPQKPRRKVAPNLNVKPEEPGLDDLLKLDV